ncbi:MAG: hypothetical protein ACRDM2_05060 [Gaiellaceae bacterium]
MRRLALLLVALVGLAACSGDDEETGSTSAATTAAASAEVEPRLVPLLTQGQEGPTQEPRIGRATARRICSSTTPALLGEAYGVEPVEDAVAGEMAARLDAPDEVRGAVRDGCLEGFPTTAACLSSWNAPENAAAREGLPGRAYAGNVYVIGAVHTPAIVPVDACVLIFAGTSGDPYTTPDWQPAAIRVRAGDEWVGASSLLGDVTNPTAVRVSAANDFESVVVILPPEPAAAARPDGTLATSG